MSTKNKMGKSIRIGLLGMLTLIGLAGSNASNAKVDTDLIERTRDIRARLLKAESSGSQAEEGQDQSRHLAGWYNFPNWPNWNNWSNWGNVWRNF